MGGFGFGQGYFGQYAMGGETPSPPGAIAPFQFVSYTTPDVQFLDATERTRDLTAVTAEQNLRE